MWRPPKIVQPIKPSITVFRVNSSASSLSRFAHVLLMLACATVSTGCQLMQNSNASIGFAPRIDRHCDSLTPETFLPRELDKVLAPTYRVAAPDILSIDVQQNVSQERHVLQPGDLISLNVTGTFPDEPISGQFQVSLGGAIELGYSYGSVEVIGQSVDEAVKLIETHLKSQLREPCVSMSLHGVAGIQRIAGEHLVGPDGTVTLGQYGSVRLAGMTLDEARRAVAEKMAAEFVDPKVSISVYAYNSKAIYVITQGGGLGDDLVRLPYTGNETVIDALSQINGLSYVSSSRMWVARPNREHGSNVMLPIDWDGITQRADVSTNYQLLPGDRVFIAQNKLVAIDSAIAKFTSPLERVLGFTLLGTATASRLSGKVLDKTYGGAGFGR